MQFTKYTKRNSNEGLVDDCTICFRHIGLNFLILIHCFINIYIKKVQNIKQIFTDSLCVLNPFNTFNYLAILVINFQIKSFWGCKTIFQSLLIIIILENIVRQLDCPIERIFGSFLGRLFAHV